VRHHAAEAVQPYRQLLVPGDGAGRGADLPLLADDGAQAEIAVLLQWRPADAGGDGGGPAGRGVQGRGVVAVLLPGC
jgi:hypothetical protein